MRFRFRRGAGRLVGGAAAGIAMLLAVPAAMMMPVTGASYTDGEYAGGVAVGVPHFTVPAITAIAGKNTTPFTGQAAADPRGYLASLVAATDDHDGDLSAQLVIDAGGFDASTPGRYTVTYDVTNSFGMAAQPVSIPVTVWNFTKIDSGYYQTLALTSDGDVWGWGYNPWGSVLLTEGDVRVPTLLTQLQPYDIVDIAAGVDTSYAVTADGAVYAWGYNGDGQYGNGSTSSDNALHQVPLPAGVVITSISASYYSVAALSSTGDVYTWGAADYGATGTGSDGNTVTPTKIMSGATQVSQGWWGGAAVDGNGSVWVWGTNLEGELGDLASGSYKFPPTMVLSSLLTDVAQVSYGGRHLLALTTSGQLYAWGQNSSNQVAPPLPVVGTTNPITVPTLVSGPSGVTQILAGYDYSMAVAGGGLWVWGNQDYGELLTGNTADVSTPTQVAGIADLGMVAGELDTTVYLTADGSTVRGAGWNGDYELGNNSTTTTSTLVTWAFTPPPL
jgi:alpha-tubulin suppressor-like RCC1 family protein